MTAEVLENAYNAERSCSLHTVREAWDMSAPLSQSYGWTLSTSHGGEDGSLEVVP